MKHKSILNTRFLIFKFQVAAVISVVCAFATAKAGAGVLPRTAKIIPPETVLLVEIDDFSRLKRQFEKTNFYKLYKDPAMAAFVDATKTKWREKIKELDNQIARTILDTGVLPQGRVAIALVSGEQTKDTDDAPFLFITQWGETIAKIKEAVDKTVKKAVEDGIHRKTREYRGVTIVSMTKELPPIQVPDMSSYKPDQNDVPMKTVQPAPVKTHYCFIDDCLIGSMNLDILKFAIAHIKGATSPTLADDADYTATLAVTGPYHDIALYVNIKQIVKTIIAEDTAGQARTFITNLGFDNVTAFGCSVGPGRGRGSSSCGKAFLKISGAKKGICKMLEPETAVIKAPRFIPASSYSAMFFNLNIKKACDELGKFLPQYAAWMYTPLPTSSSPDEPGLQLKNDIIDHLGSQIVLTERIKKPFIETSMPTEYLVALAVSNRNALEKSLSLLHSRMIAPNNPDARRELLGYTIYVVSLPGLPFFRPGMTPMQGPAEPGATQMPTLAFTITDTHLIFGTESTVEQAIRTLSSAGAASLDSAKWFNDAKSAIPEVVGLARLQDNASSIEFLWWMMKESGKTGNSSISIGPNPFLMFPQMGFDLFNFSLLPEFDAVRKYFGVSASYGMSRPDGFFFEFKDINPSGTD